MNKATASETHAYSQLPPRYSDERGFNGEAGPNPASPLLDPAVNTEDGATATDLEDDFKVNTPNLSFWLLTADSMVYQLVKVMLPSGWHSFGKCMRFYLFRLSPLLQYPPRS